MSQIHSVHSARRPVFRFLLILAGACLFSFNVNTFVHTAGLFPGGFTGVALLLRECFMTYLGIPVPFSLFYWLLNLVPAVISFRFVGRRFTLFSCLMIVASGFLTDLIPGMNVTDDVLLCSVFGGILNGVAISLCLFADATSGGTDFIAIFVSERTGRNAWNAIFAGNCVVLCIAGALFGWSRALYSIIFQFASTQILNFLYRRYAKTTLLIITEKTDEVFSIIHSLTNHSGTVFSGRGCYGNAEREMIYTVLSSEESSKVAREIRKIDPDAFINMLQTKELLGRFFRRPND